MCTGNTGIIFVPLICMLLHHDASFCAPPPNTSCPDNNTTCVARLNRGVDEEPPYHPNFVVPPQSEIIQRLFFQNQEHIRFQLLENNTLVEVPVEEDLSNFEKEQKNNASTFSDFYSEAKNSNAET